MALNNLMSTVTKTYYAEYIFYTGLQVFQNGQIFMALIKYNTYKVVNTWNWTHNTEAKPNKNPDLFL